MHILSLAGLDLELVLQLDHHAVVLLLHVVDLLDLLRHVLLPLLQTLFKIYLHQVLDVFRQLFYDGVQGLDELLYPAFNSILEMNVLLADVQAGPECFLLRHLAVDLLHNSPPLVQPPLFVIGVAEGAGLRDDFEDADLADVLPQALVAELVIELLVGAVPDADHAGVEVL